MICLISNNGVIANDVYSSSLNNAKMLKLLRQRYTDFDTKIFYY